MNSSIASIIGGFLVLSLVFVGIFIVCREIFCWYWKINQIVSLLTEIRDLASTRPQSSHGPARSVGAYGPNPPTLRDVSVGMLTADVETLLGKPQDATTGEDEKLKTRSSHGRIPRGPSRSGMDRLLSRR